jgi:hypothetical protein
MTQVRPAPIFSDRALEQIAKPSPLDTEAARALWRARVPGRWKTLLDSQTITPGAKLSTRFVWDASSRRYIDLQSRRYVPFIQIRNQAIEPFIQQSRQALRALGASLQENGDLSSWQMGAIEEVKLSQVAAGLAANGGVSSQTEDDRDKTAEIILILLLLLRGFTAELRSGKFPLNGRLFVRSDLYGNTVRGTFEEIRRFGMGAYFGAVEERRRLGIADHCTDEDDPSGELSGCEELHDLGWSPIGTLPRLGETPCRSNCYCRFEYRYKNERGDWVIVSDSNTVARILRDLNIRESIDG